jgi:hypothetical protein
MDPGAAISAYARDVSAEFFPGKSYYNLDSEDFNISMTKSGRVGAPSG